MKVTPRGSMFPYHAFTPHMPPQIFTPQTAILLLPVKVTPRGSMFSSMDMLRDQRYLTAAEGWTAGVDMRTGLTTFGRPTVSRHRRKGGGERGGTGARTGTGTFRGPR